MLSYLHTHITEALIQPHHSPKHTPTRQLLLLLNGEDKGCCQCDQIGRFIALWATFHSLWQQLFWPNCPYNLPNFYKGVKIYHFLVKSFLGNFYGHLAIFFGQTAGKH